MTVPAGAACAAPWTALHFDPHGWVTSCTANKRDVLGHVASQSLAEIWQWAAAQRFRAAFADHGLGPGCDICRWQRANGGPETMYARLYDEGEAAPGVVGPVHVEFAMSNRCNLACRMCNGGLSSTIRRREGLAPLPAAYPDRFFRDLHDLTPTIARAKFLGGEPFLATENFRIWEDWAGTGADVACHVTTNGTVWTSRMADLLEAVPMSFAVSLDGATAETVERIRVGAHFETVMANVERFADHAQRHGTDVSLTFCLMVENWFELPDFLLLADGLGLSAYVNAVFSPSRMSLYQLPPAELQRIVAALEAEEPRLSGLGRNRSVWEDQLARLRAARETPLAGDETPVHFPSLAPPRTDADRSVAPMDDPGDVERSRLWAWAPVEPTRFDVGADGTIEAVAEGHLADHHVGRLAGTGVDELFVWLLSAFGRPDHSSYLEHSASHGDRLLRFAAATTVTEVRVISTRRGAGALWWLATRHQPMDALAGASTTSIEGGSAPGIGARHRP